MPQTIKDTDGKEHEVFSQEEIDARVKEQAEQAVKEREEALTKEHEEAVAEKDQSLQSMQSELETAKEALDKADEGTKNWAEARNTIKGLNQKIEDIQAEREKEKEEFASEIRGVRTSLFSDQISGIYEQVSAGDQDVRDKIELKAKSLGIENAENLEAAQEIIKDATLLVTGKPSDPINTVRGGGGGAPPTPQAPSDKDVQELADTMGLSPEDVEKYGPRAQAKRAQQPNQSND